MGRRTAWGRVIGIAVLVSVLACGQARAQTDETASPQPTAEPVPPPASVDADDMNSDGSPDTAPDFSDASSSPDEPPAPSDAADQSPVAAEVPTIPVPRDPPSDETTAPVAHDRTELDEVVVTAQKRPQSLRDVSASVAAISGEDITKRGLVNIEQVTRAMPNVTIQTENLLAIYSVRGMGAATNYSFDPSVSAIVDDVPVFPGAIGASFLDLASIEILRGPQGTLFGKNTVAGVIKIQTQEPELEAGGFGTAYFGSYDGSKLEGVGNIPIGDSAAVRLRFAREQRRGYIENSARDEDDGGLKKSTIAAKVRYDLSSDLTLTLNLADVNVELPQGYGYQAIVCPDDYRQLAMQFDPDFECEPNLRNSRDLDEHTVADVLFANGVLSWRLGDYELKSFLAYYDYDLPFTYDADYTPVPAFTLPTLQVGHAWSGEARLVSPPDLSLFDRNLSFVSGLFFNREYTTLDTTLHIVPLPCAISPALLNLPPALGVLDGIGLTLPCQAEPTGTPITVDSLHFLQDKRVTELAAFGQADYAITDRLTLTAGARYSVVQTLGLTLQMDESCLALPVPCLATAGGYQVASLHDQELNDQSVSAKVALGYDFDSPLRLYGSVATGFKPGGYGISIFPDGAGGAQPDTYEAEDSISYEVGAKTRIFGGLGDINFAVFQSDYNNFQVLATRLLANETSNAAGARTRGAELETRWLVPADFATIFAFANVGYVDGRYTDYRTAVCPASESGTDHDNNPQTNNVCDLSGRQLANAPKWKAALLLDALIPLGDWPVMLTLGTDTTWQSKVFFQSDTDPNDSQEAYLLSSVRAGLAGVGGNWRVTFFVDNVTNKTYLQSANDITLVSGAHWGSVGAPRWYSAAVTFTF